MDSERAITIPLTLPQQSDEAAHGQRTAKVAKGTPKDPGTDENVSSDSKEQPLLLTAPQVADLCAVSSRTVWRWDSLGLLPTPVRIAGTTRWRRADVESWVQAGCPSE
jgi:predicted DNA-binding transcriptional regulator AlpA